MASAANKNAAQVAKDWATNLGNATAKITRGVQAVQTAPGQMAAANKAGYLSGVQQSVDKWATNVAAVSTASWQQSMTSKGIPRVASGAQASVPKFTAFMSQLLPAVANAQQQLQSIPRGSLSQNKQRMNAFIDAMSAFRYNKQGG